MKRTGRSGKTRATSPRSILARSALLAALALSSRPALAQSLAGEKHPRWDEPGIFRHYPRDRSIDVKHMVLALSFDGPKGWVGGDVTFTLSPLAEPLSTVALDSADLRVSKVASPGAPLGFRLSGEQLLVDLGRSVPPGEEVTFTVSYEANPRRGLFFVGPDRAYPEKPRLIYSQGEGEENHWWFPCYDSPNDRATFEQFLTVAEPLTALGNGRLVDVKAGPGGKRTFHFKQEVAAPSYLISVAIGDFDIVRQDYEGIPVEYYVPRGTPREAVLHSFGETPAMMKFFSEKIGVRYPYAKYAQSAIVDFIYGGMENISATTQTFETIHPAEVEKEASSRGLVAHELAHQWWGDLLTCRDWAHAWLNEGFATYFENLYQEQRAGREEFEYEMLQDARAYLKEDSEEYRRPIVQPVYADGMDLFDSHLYPKGGWSLHMLRGIVGDDLFWKAIHRYAEEHRDGLVVTDDLRRAFESVTGQSLVWFFEEWFDHGGHPEYALRQEWDGPQKAIRLTVEQKQQVDDVTPLFRMPVRIEFIGKEQTREFTVTVARATEEFSFPFPEPPRMTRFDAGARILKTLEFERSLEELKYQLEHDPDVAGRTWAAEQLGSRTLDASAALGLAARLEREEFWGVRAEIAKSLGKIRLPQARDALVRALRDADTRVRASALDALGRFREDASAAAAIRSAFRRETNPFVRSAAAKAYSTGRAPDAFALLKEAAAIPSYKDVIAVGAYEGMQELGDPRALPLLEQGARYGRPRRQREAAIRALGKLARGEAQRDVGDFLMPLLQDPWIFARDAAIQALGDAREERAVPALADAARGEIDPRLRRHARKAVAAIRSAKAGTALEDLRARIEQLKETTESLRERMNRLEGEKGKSLP
ncbi:MAG TPA: M1 family aminopeptidase [Candidatus Polarisedimenticolia bacterium]|nr:M1 family aminopeptidase [Candidatus Polarisedimenticolia bacterium]